MYKTIWSGHKYIWGGGGGRTGNELIPKDLWLPFFQQKEAAPASWVRGAKIALCVLIANKDIAIVCVLNKDGHCVADYTPLVALLFINDLAHNAKDSGLTKPM